MRDEHGADRLDHRVIHVGARARSNAFHGAGVAHPTGATDRLPGGGRPDVHGPGAATTTPARTRVPSGGGDPCPEWPGSTARMMAHLDRRRDRRGVAVELGPMRHPNGRGFGRGVRGSVHLRDPDGSPPEFGEVP